MALGEAMDALAGQALASFPDGILFTDPNTARAGARPTVSVYRSSQAVRVLGRVHTLQVLFRVPLTREYPQPHEITRVYDAADALCDSLRETDSWGDLYVHWPSGVDVEMNYDDGSVAIVTVPLTTQADYGKV